MITAQLEKLKNSIKPDLLEKFDKNLMVSSGFIPVDIRNNDIFIIIKKSVASNKPIIENQVKSVCQNETGKAKFISLADDDFGELYSALLNQIVQKAQEPNLQLVSSENTTEELVKNIDLNPSTTIRVPATPEMSDEEFFLANGWIQESYLAPAKELMKTKKMPLYAALLANSFITEEQVRAYLKSKYNTEMITADDISVDLALFKGLPDDFIFKKCSVPFEVSGSKLKVAMLNPLDKNIIREISFSTGRSVIPFAMTFMDFELLLKDYTNKRKQLQTAKETERIMQSLEEEAAQYQGETSLWTQVEKELQNASSSVAKLVYKIITDGIDQKVSDIHVEPRLYNYIVRFRADGLLKKVLEIPSSVENSVITRFKVLARMNIAEHRRPQDGTFSIKYNDKAYDFRINTLPVSGKEKVVIRILAPAVSLKSSGEDIKIEGAQPWDIEKIKTMVKSPNGIILTSGPTGSGKTTTLYTILKSLNKEDVNITTIEDPIEIKLEGINQSQVNAKADITFASCMRAILRQDPDIILVGEIRDYETLEVAISAALTGHLVLSTVHTNSAAATITRLIEMGAKDYLVSSTLTGVIAQRLVRRLCDNCKEEYYPSEEEVKHLTVNEEEQKQLLKTKMYRPVGCEECGFLGYKGRLGLYEILPMSREIKKLIAQGAHDIEIEEAAVAAGMRTLNQSCLQHIIDGKTTVDEFVRVLGFANE